MLQDDRYTGHSDPEFVAKGLAHGTLSMALKGNKTLFKSVTELEKAGCKAEANYIANGKTMKDRICRAQSVMDCYMAHMADTA